MVRSLQSEIPGSAWKHISISLSRPLAFLLLLLWISGCGPNLKVPLYATGVLLDIPDFNTVLEIVDVADPANPIRMSSISLPSRPEHYSSITVWKHFVLATTAYGIHFIDVVNPLAPRLLWNLPLATLSGNVVMFTDFAFVPTRNGLYVLYIKSPMEPKWVFHTGHKENIRSHLIDLKIRGNYAYARDAHKYLHVFDLTQPKQPKLVNSYAVNSPSSLLLFRVLREEAELIQPTFNSLTDEISMFHLTQLELPSALSLQLADWNNLLELTANWVVKAQMSSQYFCWVYLHDDIPRIWFLPSDGNRIYPLDVIPEYIKYQYNSGTKKRPGGGDVTDVIKGAEDTLYIISQDKWVKTVKIDRSEEGRITDFQLSENLVYILREHGGLFIAKLSPTRNSLKGMALIENLSHPSQCLTADKTLLYILGNENQSKNLSK